MFKTKKIKEFFAERDDLAKDFTLTLNGKTSHGTCIGGLCTILARIFFMSFFAVIIWGLIVKPQYNAQEYYEVL